MLTIKLDDGEFNPRCYDPQFPVEGYMITIKPDDEEFNPRCYDPQFPPEKIEEIEKSIEEEIIEKLTSSGQKPSNLFQPLDERVRRPSSPIPDFHGRFSSPAYRLSDNTDSEDTPSGSHMISPTKDRRRPLGTKALEGAKAVIHQAAAAADRRRPLGTKGLEGAKAMIHQAAVAAGKAASSAATEAGRAARNAVLAAETAAVGLNLAPTKVETKVPCHSAYKRLWYEATVDKFVRLAVALKKQTSDYEEVRKHIFVVLRHELSWASRRSFRECEILFRTDPKNPEKDYELVAWNDLHAFIAWALQCIKVVSASQGCSRFFYSSMSDNVYLALRVPHLSLQCERSLLMNRGGLRHQLRLGAENKPGMSLPKWVKMDYVKQSSCTRVHEHLGVGLQSQWRSAAGDELWDIMSALNLSRKKEAEPEKNEKQPNYVMKKVFQGFGRKKSLIISSTPPPIFWTENPELMVMVKLELVPQTAIQNNPTSNFRNSVTFLEPSSQPSLQHAASRNANAPKVRVVVHVRPDSQPVEMTRRSSADGESALGGGASHGMISPFSAVGGVAFKSAANKILALGRITGGHTRHHSVGHTGLENVSQSSAAISNLAAFCTPLDGDQPSALSSNEPLLAAQSALQPSSSNTYPRSTPRLQGSVLGGLMTRVFSRRQSSESNSGITVESINAGLALGMGHEDDGASNAAAHANEVSRLRRVSEGSMALSCTSSLHGRPGTTLRRRQSSLNTAKVDEPLTTSPPSKATGTNSGPLSPGRILYQSADQQLWHTPTSAGPLSPGQTVHPGDSPESSRSLPASPSGPMPSAPSLLASASAATLDPGSIRQLWHTPGSTALTSPAADLAPPTPTADRGASELRAQGCDIVFNSMAYRGSSYLSQTAHDSGATHDSAEENIPQRVGDITCMNPSRSSPLSPYTTPYPDRRLAHSGPSGSGGSGARASGSSGGQAGSSHSGPSGSCGSGAVVSGSNGGQAGSDHSASQGQHTLGSLGRAPQPGAFTSANSASQGQHTLGSLGHVPQPGASSWADFMAGAGAGAGAGEGFSSSFEWEATRKLQADTSSGERVGDGQAGTSSGERVSDRQAGTSSGERVGDRQAGASSCERVSDGAGASVQDRSSAKSLESVDCVSMAVSAPCSGDSMSMAMPSYVKERLRDSAGFVHTPNEYLVLLRTSSTVRAGAGASEASFVHTPNEDLDLLRTSSTARWMPLLDPLEGAASSDESERHEEIYSTATVASRISVDGIRHSHSPSFLHFMDSQPSFEQHPTTQDSFVTATNAPTFPQLSLQTQTSVTFPTSLDIGAEERDSTQSQSVYYSPSSVVLSPTLSPQSDVAAPEQAGRGASTGSRQSLEAGPHSPGWQPSGAGPSLRPGWQSAKPPPSQGSHLKVKITSPKGGSSRPRLSRQTAARQLEPLPEKKITWGPPVLPRLLLAFRELDRSKLVNVSGTSEVKPVSSSPSSGPGPGPGPPLIACSTLGGSPVFAGDEVLGSDADLGGSGPGRSTEGLMEAFPWVSFLPTAQSRRGPVDRKEIIQLHKVLDIF
eukprot:gene31849-7055_t